MKVLRQLVGYMPRVIWQTGQSCCNVGFRSHMGCCCQRPVGGGEKPRGRQAVQDLLAQIEQVLHRLAGGPGPA